jgi:alginate O-acetyltransferase complex protein AlgI
VQLGGVLYEQWGGRAPGKRPMIFNSLTFLVFFAVVMALHYAPFFSWHQKKINLMIASYLFYAAWNPPFVILLWVSTVL